MGKHIKSLEHHSNMLSQLVKRLAGVHWFSHVINLTGIIGFQLVDAAENGGFAGTAGSQNCDLFPFVDVEADSFKYFQISEALADIFYA